MDYRTLDQNLTIETRRTSRGGWIGEVIYQGSLILSGEAADTEEDARELAMRSAFWFFNPRATESASPLYE